MLKFKNPTYVHRSDCARQTHLLCSIYDCSVTIRMKSGETFYALPGDIIYIPQGACYVFEMNDKKSDMSCAIGINFVLYHKNGMTFSSCGNPVIFNVSNFEYYNDIFFKMYTMSAASVQSTSRLKSCFYEIVSTLCEECLLQRNAGKEYWMIEKGIHYLETDYRLDKSVADIAAMCAVSENYFRKLFKQYSGVSPKEYILKAKTEKAKMALKETNMPISEIAEMYGFQDAAYFSRIFKKRTGISPHSYRYSK